AVRRGRRRRSGSAAPRPRTSVAAANALAKSFPPDRAGCLEQVPLPSRPRRGCDASRTRTAVLARPAPPLRARTSGYAVFAQLCVLAAAALRPPCGGGADRDQLDLGIQLVFQLRELGVGGMAGNNEESYRRLATAGRRR